MNLFAQSRVQLDALRSELTLHALVNARARDDLNPHIPVAGCIGSHEAEGAQISF